MPLSPTFNKLKLLVVLALFTGLLWIRTYLPIKQDSSQNTWEIVYQTCEDNDFSALRVAQRTFFDNHLKSGLGYARFFSNKAWTDQVAIALYFRALGKTLSSPHTTLLFLDVGANVGQTVRFVSALFRSTRSYYPPDTFLRSISAEPSPSTFLALKREVLRARKSDAGGMYAALNVGIGSKPGTLPFYSWGRGDQGATLNSRATQGRPVYKRVEVCTIDELALRSGAIFRSSSSNFSSGKHFEGRPPENVVVKVDVEGFELEALQGARRALTTHQIGALVWEWAPEKMSRGSLKAQVKYISSFGYEVFISTLRAMIRVDGDLWDDAYESTRKTINLAAYVSGSGELLHIKQSHYLCRAVEAQTKCDCWSGRKVDLPPDAFHELLEDGFPMGRE